MPKGEASPLSRIPAVDKILHALDNAGRTAGLPRPLVTEVVRNYLAALRDRAQDGETAGFESILSDIEAQLDALDRSRIRPVINGTGVIIHTNLGRAPLSRPATEAISAVGQCYNNIEFDQDSGQRGQRGVFLERCLAQLCRAEAATVVNNCAAALVLILKYLARGERNEVIISRGQLIEIGGGFRIPEILEASGAALREVGATNKTSLADYEAAIGPRTGMILKVHRSNFYQAGFVAEPALEELVALGRERKLPVVEDLGSGAILATESLAPIPHEPTPAEVLGQGADLVCVSGDKLLGGPQAGIIAGRADLVAGLKKAPFYRALRCDKLVLTGLQEVAAAYLTDGFTDLPLARMLALNPDEDLRPRAKQLLHRLNHAGLSIGKSIARCGGGTMPRAEIPSITIDIRPANQSLGQLARRLRLGDPPVIAYAADNCLRIDLRTVFPEQDEILARQIQAAITV